MITADGQLADLWNAKTLVANFGLLFAGYPYFGMMGINNPVWYVCVLIQCYLLFYLLEWGFRKLAADKQRRWRLGTYLAIVCIAVPAFRCGLLNEGSFRGITSFSLGVLICLAYQVCRDRPIVHRKWLGMACIALAFVLCGLVLLGLRQRWTLQFFVFPIFVFGLLHLDLLGTKVISTLGEVSFDLYVIHYPLMVLVQLILAVTGGVLVHSYATMGVFLLSSWFIAGLMWRYMDLPLRALAKRVELKLWK